MKKNIEEFEGVKILKPAIFPDERGFFSESFPFSWKNALPPFVQDNFARSKKGVLRGLHFQEKAPQAKLIWVSYGTIFDVIVDIRKDSPNFGQVGSIILDDQSLTQLFIPEGFLHGYLVLSKTANVHYKVSSPYLAEDAKSVFYLDPDLNIEWPIKDPIVSEKDQKAPFFRTVFFDRIPL